MQFLQLAAQCIAAPAGGCLHLSLHSKEMAEGSSASYDIIGRRYKRWRTRRSRPTISAYLLPGLTGGIFARSGGRLSAGKFSTVISTRLTNGQPKFGFDLPLRSPITPTAEMMRQ